MSQPAGAKSSDSAAPQPDAEIRDNDRAALPSDLEATPWLVLDACFADEAWASPIELFHDGLAGVPARTSELDLLVATVALAATVQFAHVEPATPTPPEHRGRRGISRSL
jgi:hypothetical protein